MMYSDEDEYGRYYDSEEEQSSGNEISDEIDEDSEDEYHRRRRKNYCDDEEEDEFLYSSDSDAVSDTDVHDKWVIMSTNCKYPTTLMASLKTLRDEDILSDITIKVGDKTFEAHKALLAATSGYFRTMFTSKFKERRQDEVAIDGKSKIFEQLLKSVYTGKLSLTVGTLLETFNMALYMQFNHSFPLILSFLTNPVCKGLPLDIAFQISVLVIRGSYKNECLNEIKEVCNDRIRKSWMRFTKMEGFLQDVTEEFLEDVLACGRFACKENELLKSVVLWLKHDWESRDVYSSNLLKNLRLGLVEADDLNQLIDEQIKEKPECLNLLMEALRIDSLGKEEEAKRQADFKAHPKPTNKHSWFARQIGLYQPFRERFPGMCATRTTVTVLISTGGKANKKSGASYFVLDGKGSTKPGWKEFSKFYRYIDSDNVHDHTSIVVNGMIYLVGGTTIKQLPRLRRVCTTYLWTFSMDPEKYVAGWRCPTNMIVARRKFGMAYLKPHIYVIGGLDNKGVIANVERFVIADYRWEVMPPLPQKCQYMSVVVWQSMLIVYGCHVKPPIWSQDDEMYTIQVFDSKKMKWFGAGFTEAHCSWSDVKPAIMEHEGRYYRVIFEKASQSSASKNGGSGDNKRKVPKNYTLVQELIKEVQDGRFIVTMGDIIDQSCIPPNKAGAFRIADNVFVNASGYIHKTDVKVSSDGGVDLGLWNLVNIDTNGVDKRDAKLRDSVTCLTYDTKITKQEWRV